MASSKQRDGLGNHGAALLGQRGLARGAELPERQQRRRLRVRARVALEHLCLGRRDRRDQRELIGDLVPVGHVERAALDEAPGAA